MIASSKNIKEEERVILRQASNRIRDIANDLTFRFKEKNTSSRDESKNSSPTKIKPELVPILIDEIVTEFRLRFRARMDLEIQANIDESNYGLFAWVDQVNFKRALSNLIENAVEALPKAGKIQILSKSVDGKIIIDVIDNGKGIDETLLPRLAERGATFGKTQGSGLGLFHAKQTIEEFHGKLEIESKLGFGTTVRMTLPKATKPDWFLPEFNFHGDSTVVILDDDQSIHQVWIERFSRTKQDAQIELIHFTSGLKFREWYKQNQETARNAHYFIDYELIGEEENGLSIILSLGLQKRAVLVTSRYDEIVVRSAVEKEELRLLPKGLSSLLPINIYKEPIFAVLIDDDPLNHSMWSLSAKAANKNILTLFSDKDFYHHAVPHDTPIYVDRNLSNGEFGENVLQRFHDHGFTHLYLHTGESVNKSDFPGFPFIREVYSKGEALKAFV